MTRPRRLALLALVLTFLLATPLDVPLSGASRGEEDPSRRDERAALASVPIENRFLVGLHDLPAEAREYQDHRVLAVNERLRYVVVEAPTEAGLRQRLAHDPNVRYVNADHQPGLQLFAAPNDALYADPGHYGTRVIGAERAWDVTMGDTGVTVAVLDSGIDRDHPDLAGTRVLQGYDYVSWDTDPEDEPSCSSHGTHVAGIAGATLNNARGIAGVSQHTILPYKILGGASCTNGLHAIATALTDAGAAGADIVTNSWGIYPFDSRYSFDGGVSWGSDDARRGFRVVFGGSAGTLQNGGAGTAWDATDHRGKFFPASPTGTITQVCVYGRTAGTTAQVALKPLPNAAASTYSTTISVTVNSGWSCASVNWAWTHDSLFIYKTGGNAEIGAESTPPDVQALEQAVELLHQQGVLVVAAAGNDGPCLGCVGYPWRNVPDETLIVSASNAQEDFATTYTGGIQGSSHGPEVDIMAPGDTILSTVGFSWDATNLRAKSFGSVPTGTITQVCVYARDAGTSATVALKPAAQNVNVVHSVTVPVTQGSAWNCASGSWAWSAPTLHLYKTGGTAHLGADIGFPADSTYSSDGGATWALDPAGVRRGYRVTFSDGTTLQNGGDGYQRMSGTSMAAPFVAGAAALLKAQNPTWTGTQLAARLVATADDTGEPAQKQGAGRLDVAAALGAGPVLENGGAGPLFDAINYRGKLFAQSPTGTISKVCVFGQTAGTSATVDVKPNADNGPVTFTVVIPITTGNAWNCVSGGWGWTASSLFLYKRTGTAAIGADNHAPSDSRYSDNGGSTWASDPTTVRRGYRVVFAGSGSGTTELQNGGEGPLYDTTLYRGKLFATAPRGTITQVCVFGQTAGTSATVDVKPNADNGPVTFSVTVPITASGGWSCASGSWAWTASSLFVYKRLGDAAIGADNNAPSDSRYSDNGGATWAPDPTTVRRGYRIVFAPGATLENGGAGPLFDTTNHRGKLFAQSPTGTISQVCVFGQTAGTSATLDVKPNADNGPVTFSVVVPISTGNAWNCASGAWGWTASSLFVYKRTGNAAIGADNNPPSDSRYSDNGGSTWAPDPTTVRRGYKVGFA